MSPSEQYPISRRSKNLLWISMIVGIIGAGIAFTFKIAEFIHTLGADEVRGFAEVPVITYFFVAGGWLSVLIWCFKTGKFRNLEQPKFDMLAQEEEYERLGQ